MAIYNVNQNRQFYVVNSVVTTEPTQLGQVKLVSTDDGQIFFKHFGQGGLTRTDLIDKDKVCYARLTEKADMRRYLKTATVTLNSDYLSSDDGPIAGQDYILRIQINNYLSPGDASVLIRSGAVHATKGMTADQFYTKMVESLTRNFSRDPQPLLKFETVNTTTGSGDSAVTKATGIKINEAGDQPWRLGVLSQTSVNFEVIPTTITYDGEEVVWMTTNDKGYVEVTETTDFEGNGKEIADLEYFCQAERGDMFRNMGWPNNIDVKYMVDPSKEYDVLDLHYYFSGNGVQVHKSEKDITFVTDTASVMTALKTAITGAGITVTTKAV